MITSKYKVGVHMINFLVIEFGEMPGLLALVPFISIGAYTLFTYLKKYLKMNKNNEIQISGEIVSYAEEDIDNVKYYSPVYRYQYNGIEYLTTSSSRTTEKNELGKPVMLIINKNNPNIMSDNEKNYIPSMILLGSIFFLISLLILILIIIK